MTTGENTEGEWKNCLNEDFCICYFLRHRERSYCERRIKFNTMELEALMETKTLDYSKEI